MYEKGLWWRDGGEHQFEAPSPPRLAQRKGNKAALSPLGAQGLTSAAELFPGWGHPALWCLSARPTPRSWCCPGARHGDGCERRTGGRTAAWRGAEPREVRGRMTKTDNGGEERNEMLANRFAGKAENSPKGIIWAEKRGEQRGRPRCRETRPPNLSRWTKDTGRKLKHMTQLQREERGVGGLRNV